MFAISMHGVSDFTWMVSETFSMQNRAVADRPDLDLPEILIEQLENTEDWRCLAAAASGCALAVLWFEPMPGVRCQRPVGPETVVRRRPSASQAAGAVVLE